MPKQTYKCVKCGATLTKENCRPCETNYTGFAAMCLDCEEERFEQLSEAQGRYLALYSCCIAFDVPLIPLVLENVDLDSLDNAWKAYLRLLTDKGELSTADGTKSFLDGIQSVWQVFGNEQKYHDFNARIRVERDRLQKEKDRKEKKAQEAEKYGTPEQQERWGVGMLYKSNIQTMPNLYLNAETYADLDRVFETRVSAFKGQDLTPQQLSVLIRVSKKEVIADHLTKYGLVKPATEVEKSISSLLADENMRPKDKRPVEELRLDALVLSLEEAGLMENGDLLDYDELVKVLQDKFVKSKKYNYSLDVADQMILDIRNCMAINADLPPIQDLPEELAPVDEYGEFAPEETEREKENKRFLGITKVNIVKSEPQTTEPEKPKRKTATKKNKNDNEV